MVLNVAIIGGGVGGLTTAIALRQHPNIHVEVYERTTAFREIGAVIGLAPNGLRTLEKLGVDDVLGDEAGWRNPSGIPMIFRHWKTNETLAVDANHHVPDRRHHFARMHRATLQKALLKRLPQDILHLGKKAASVEVNEQAAKVTFEDQTSVTADLIVGADGIKSKIREAFVPAHQLTSAGDVLFRTTFPCSLVADIKDLHQDSIHYQSPSAWFFGTRIGSDGYAVTCSFRLDDSEKSRRYKDIVWNAPAEVDEIRDVFKDFYHVIPEIVNRIPAGSLRRYVNIAGAALDHWTFGGRVVLLGDAAHTHGGAYAAGASLAIDDAYALYLALRAVFPEAWPMSEPISPGQIGRALSLYESTRQPHAAKVLERVHEGRRQQAARSQALQEQKLSSETDEVLRAKFKGREDPVWLNEHDVEAAFRAVLAGDQGREQSKL